MFILATSSQVNPDWRTYVMLVVYLLIIGYYGYKQATGDLVNICLGEILVHMSPPLSPALLI